MNRVAGVLLAVVCLNAVPGCDWVDELTGPSIPEVAGTYTGPVTAEATVGAMTITVTGSMTVVAAQDGDRVTLSGSLTVEGETEALDAVPGTIGGDGLWTQDPDAPGGFAVEADDDCGITVDSTVRFSGGTLTIEASGTSPEPTMECPSARLSATLTRG